MPPVLLSIEVDNFKSYKGQYTIGPLKTFTAVIGPNGSGKSNFMDAISFVMGEKTTALRVKRLSDLIHGASINKPVARSAGVTAVFQMEDDSLKRFTRSVQGTASDYKINREPVTTQKYMSELEAIGINVKAKNFLVFQGAVESIAMKNPKERTVLFEEISGSGAVKEEYDRLKTEMLKAEEETNCSYLKKRGVVAERKEAKMEKEEAEKYQRLKEELAEREVEYQLFRLFYNENDIKHYESELEKKRRDLEKVEKKKEKAEEVLKEKKKDQGKINRELAKNEQEIREMEVEINKKRPAFIKSKERVAHIQKKTQYSKKIIS
uniref:RecF/RecN/SMC N-terminal domain-containing protein n=1 Tax=Clastoptera arizonana TaxID=38151 RepID=A0A1B6DA24_9HEMI